MPAPLRDIRESPDEPALVMDDEARALLLHVGLLGRFEQAAELTEAAPRVAITYCSEHPTHWLMATFLRGFANPEDNGYVVHCLPKSRFTAEEATEFMDRHEQKIAPGERSVFVQRFHSQAN